MLIGIGCTVPEIVNLPGQSGGEVEVVLNYSSASACNNNNAFSPTQATPSGGVFSATPSGLNINSSTGEVTPVGSTPQAYVITYTVGSSTSTFDLTINPSDNAGFSYSASSFPQDGSDPSPTITGLSGGTFSATPSGLSINTSTGEINLSASTIGSYTITYNTASSGSSVCPNTSNVSLAVGGASLAQVNNVYSMEFDGTNDYIDLGDSDAFSFGNSSTDSPFSISMWGNITNGVNFRGVQKISGSLYEYRFNTLTTGVVRFNLFDSNGSNFIGVDGGSLTSYAGQWIHLVATYDGSSTSAGCKIYLNGSPLSTTPSSLGNYTAMHNTTAPVEIGRLVTTYTNGLIDEVAIFNVELTANDVQRIYNATEVGKTADLNDLTTPPVKWYRMGD